MDSGGSYHITYRRDYLVDFEEYDGGNILLGDGRECRVRGTCKVQVHMRDGSSFVLDNVMYISELSQNLILLGTLEKEGFTMMIQSAKIKVIKGSLMVLSGTRKANCVYTLDGQVMTRKTLKGRKQLGEYQTGWKIKTCNVLNSCNQRSTQQCTKSGVAKHLGVAGLQQQNGLVKETNMTLSTKVVLYRNMGFKESGEYKKTFIGSGVCTGSVQVLQGVEFEVELDDNNGYYWEYTLAKGNVLGMEIVRDQSGNTLRVSQSRFYNEKLVQTLLEGHFILSLEGSLSGNCDMEKNGKMSCIYAVGSQEYQVVCTRPDIASADGAKEAIWLKGLAIESGFELKIVAGITTRALSTAIPRSSGESDADLVENAKKSYMKRYANKKFQYDHVWNILKNYPKWNASEPIDEDNLQELFGPDPRESPANKQRAMKKQKLIDTSSSEGSTGRSTGGSQSGSVSGVLS
nr:zinc finger, CCHC-type [Tanacetum cinerariifolium]